jgi:hypothetical protein
MGFSLTSFPSHRSLCHSNPISLAQSPSSSLSQFPLSQSHRNVLEKKVLAIDPVYLLYAMFVRFFYFILGVSILLDVIKHHFTPGPD